MISPRYRMRVRVQVERGTIWHLALPRRRAWVPAYIVRLQSKTGPKATNQSQNTE